MGSNKPPGSPMPPKRISVFRIPPCNPLDVLVTFAIVLLYGLNIAHQFISIPEQEPFTRDLSNSVHLRWFIYELGIYASAFVGFWLAFTFTPYKRSYIKGLFMFAALHYTWDIVDLIIWDNRHSQGSLYWENGLMIIFFVYSLYRSAKWRKKLKDATVSI